MRNLGPSTLLVMIGGFREGEHVPGFHGVLAQLIFFLLTLWLVTPLACHLNQCNTMKLLQNADPINGVTLFGSDDGLKLKRFAIDSYSIISPDRTVPLITFKSLKFSILINGLLCDVEKVLVHPKIPTPGRSFEIQLHLSYDEIIVMSSNGDVHKVSKIHIQSNSDDVGLFPAKDIFQELPDSLPYSGMLLDLGLVDTLRSSVEKNTAKRVLKTLWDENIEEGSLDLQQISGQYGEFISLQFLCGRVAFMSASPA
jgi:hypothetical protein